MTELINFYSPCIHQETNSFPQETADLVTFTEEILNGKLHFFVQCNFFQGEYNFFEFTQICLKLETKFGGNPLNFKTYQNSASWQSFDF